MTKPVKVAVIGAGNMGLNHVRKYAELKLADLVAIADPNPDVAKTAKEFSVQHFADYREMLDKVKPQAVSIVVPTPLHFEVAREVLSRKVNAIVEKPIAHTVVEATALIDLAKKNKLIFTVGHVEHYNPVILKLKELIKQKKLGDITSVVCKRVGGFPANEPKTDVIIDLAVHDIGIINDLIGKYPKQIYSHGSRTLHTSRIDAAEILMDYGGTSGFIQANWITPVKVRNISITGSEGYVEANYITQELFYYEQTTKRVNEGFETFVKMFGDPKEHIIKVNFEEPLKRELQTFLKAINDGKARDLVKPEDAREALRIALLSVEKYNRD